MLDVTDICKRTAHIPSQKTPAYSPEDSLNPVHGEVESRVEAEAAVHNDRDGKSGDRKEGSRCELYEFDEHGFTAGEAELLLRTHLKVHGVL